MKTKTNQEKPKWFKGAWYSTPEEVTNPFSGETCLLTGAEASMYDFIMGATYTIEVTFDMDSNVEDPYITKLRKELIKAYEYLSTEDQILLKKWVSEFVSNKSELKTVYLGVIS